MVRTAGPDGQPTVDPQCPAPPGWVSRDGGAYAAVPGPSSRWAGDAEFRTVEFSEWWSERGSRFDPGFVAEFETRQGIARAE